MVAIIITLIILSFDLSLWMIVKAASVGCHQLPYKHVLRPQRHRLLALFMGHYVSYFMKARDVPIDFLG